MSNTYIFNFQSKTGISCSYELKYSFKYRGHFTELDKDKLLSTFRAEAKPIAESYDLVYLIKNRNQIESQILRNIEQKLSDDYKHVKVEIQYLIIPKKIKDFLESKGENLDRIKSEQ